MLVATWNLPKTLTGQSVGSICVSPVTSTLTNSAIVGGLQKIAAARFFRDVKFRGNAGGMQWEHMTMHYHHLPIERFHISGDDRMVQIADRLQLAPVECLIVAIRRFFDVARHIGHEQFMKNAWTEEDTCQ